MSLHSKFRFRAFVPVALLLLVTGLLVFVSVELLGKPDLPGFAIFAFFVIFVFAWIWLVFGELRTKVVRVHVIGEEVIVSNYLGLGAKRVFSFHQFDGLETALLPSRYDSYEYLYLIKNGKKVVKLSQFYHANYAELKNALKTKVRNLGKKRFSYLQEVKEIFT